MQTSEKWPERAGLMGVRESYYITCWFLYVVPFLFKCIPFPYVQHSKIKNAISTAREKGEAHPQVSQNDSHEGRSGTGARLDWHDIRIGLIQREKHVCCLLARLHNSQQPGKVSIGIWTSQEIHHFLPVEDLPLQSLSHAA